MEDRVLPLLLLCLCSSGLWAEDTLTEVSDEASLLRGGNNCTARLKIADAQEWTALNYTHLEKIAASVCRKLNCGSVMSPPTHFTPHPINVEITCSESIRLVNGSDRCSGRLEVKSNQSWSKICEGDFDQQDAQVVCRELSCGTLPVLREVLYGEMDAPVWSREFHCEGNESHLLDCDSSTHTRNSCSPARTVELTCSDSVDARLVGGANQCTGELQLRKYGLWKAVHPWYLRLNPDVTNIICRQMDCGSMLSPKVSRTAFSRPVWNINSSCFDAKHNLSECALPDLFKQSFDKIEVACTESIRLVNGSDRCSGRLEVKSNQSWSNICEGDFDQQAAQVVCRELGCGTLPVLKGVPHGEMDAPVWSGEFHCEGNESHLLDCDSPTHARNSCSPARTVVLTCSDSVDVRLVGGANQCTGELQLRKYRLWRAVKTLDSLSDIHLPKIVCRQLDCGSMLPTKLTRLPRSRPAWMINSFCLQTKQILGECVSEDLDARSSYKMEITCSESIRLVNGSDRCSGRLEVRTNLSWSSVCESDFDQQIANVVCEELGCRPPSVFHGALYGEVEAPVWTGKFWCEGNEHHLLDCRRSDAAVNMCSPDKAVGITCSGVYPIMLVGEKSRCGGIVEIKAERRWRPVSDLNFPQNQMLADIVCRHLDCGSVVLKGSRRSNEYMWSIEPACSRSGFADPKCKLRSVQGFASLEVICTDLLTQPNITVFPYIDLVLTSEHQRFHVLIRSDFTITCSTQAQYEGGSFQLLHNSSNTVKVYVLPAVNHSAHFNFSTAHRGHEGEYTCVYSVHVYSYNFSSESQPIRLVVSALLIELMIRLVIHLVVLTALISSHFIFAKCYLNPRRLEGRRVSTR